MCHAIEEEEKVPMEQVTNFQEVTNSLEVSPRLWTVSFTCGLWCTYCMLVLGP